MASKRKSRKRGDFPSENVSRGASPYTQETVARIIRVATRRGGLRDRNVVVEVVESGQIIAREFSINDGLKLRLDGAARYAAFTRAWQQRTRKDSDLISMFSRIEKSARGLLLALQVSKATDNLPIPAWLHHGGLHWQAANDPIAAARSVTNNPPGMPASVAGMSLIRDAICGVEDIERWVRNARQHLERPAGTEEIPADQEARLPNDPYREWVAAMASIWRDIFNRADTDSRAFGAFLAEAAGPIGIVISADSGRKILRETVGKFAKRRRN